jgi:bifunctional non-homologous end joining protein LigD
MRLAVRRKAFTHPDWLFEIKYEGFRSLARITAGQSELISRRRGDAFSYAFDLLWLDGRDLRSLPPVDRKVELERLVPADSRLLYVRHLGFVEEAREEEK